MACTRAFNGARVAAECEEIADMCDRLARRVERDSWLLAQEIMQAAATLNEAAAGARAEGRRAAAARTR